MLDIILIILLIAYFVTGLRKGFFVSLGALAGFAGGVFAAYLLTPWAIKQVSAAWYVPVAILSILGCLVIGQWLGFLLGSTLRRVSDMTPLRWVERLLGGLLSLTVCAVMMLVAVLAVRPAGIPPVNAAISDSRVVDAMLRATPPSVQEQIDKFRVHVLHTAAIPQVSDLLFPSQQAPTTNSSTSAMERSSESVVQIVGAAQQCNYMSEGSGFVVAPDYAVTNAHVVAGVEEPMVQNRSGGGVKAQVVYFDPKQDLAVLHAPGLRLEPLRVDQDVAAGTPVEFMGYPLGGPFETRPATVQGLGRAQTVDVQTGERTESRLVYQLAAKVDQGNSGGPVIEADGDVVGVMFAKATQGETGYAIPASVLNEVLAGLDTYTQPVSHGRCTRH